jgi:integrase
MAETTINRLDGTDLRSLTEPGYYPDGQKLYFRVNTNTKRTKSWMLRYSFGGRDRQFGIGPWPATSLKQARIKAAAARTLLDQGTDPKAQKDEARLKAKWKTDGVPTLKAWLNDYIHKNPKSWRKRTHSSSKSQWRQSFARHVFWGDKAITGKEGLGSVPVNKITRDMILHVLTRPVKPAAGPSKGKEAKRKGDLSFWTTYPETASRVRSRLHILLNAAVGAGHCAKGENAAQWAGGLDALLPSPSQLKKARLDEERARRGLTIKAADGELDTGDIEKDLAAALENADAFEADDEADQAEDDIGHFAAAPYKEIPELVADLRKDGSVEAFALEWLILTATRRDETAGTDFREIDPKNRLWQIPGGPTGRMKAGKRHRVPLPVRCLQILREMLQVSAGPVKDEDGKVLHHYVFPAGHDPLAHIGGYELLRCLHRIRPGRGFTVHGLRSSFKNWVTAETQFSDTAAEIQLAHAVGTKVKRAYDRADQLAKRRAIVDAWAAYCEGPNAADNVFRLKPRKAG